MLVAIATGVQAYGYGVYIAGTEITDFNHNDLGQISGVTVSDGGYVSFLEQGYYYDNSPATLTLKNVTINSMGCCIENRSCHNLIIEIEGEVTLTSLLNYGILLKAPTSLKGYYRPLTPHSKVTVTTVSLPAIAITTQSDDPVTFSCLIMEISSNAGGAGISGVSSSSTSGPKLEIEDCDMEIKSTNSFTLCDFRSVSIGGASKVCLRANDKNYYPMVGVYSLTLGEDMAMTSPNGYFRSGNGCNIYNNAGQEWLNDVEFTTTAIAVNETNFPDYWFRTEVVDIYDRNYDDFLTKSEIRNVTRMEFSGDIYHWPNNEKIRDLTGITLFTSLEELDCSAQKLTSLTIPLSVKKLICGNNQLTSFNAILYPNLQYLDCSGNQLTSLTFSSSGGNNNLETLICNKTLLASLSLGYVPNLQKLECNNNSRLSMLDVSACSKLKSLDCSSNSSLKNYYMGTKNLLTYLNVSNNPNFGYSYHQGIVEALPHRTTSATFVPSAKISKQQVATARSKGWSVNKEGYEAYQINDQNNFRDRIFRDFLLQQSYGSDDGWIDENEIPQVTTLNVSNLGIESMKGVEIFTYLRTLDVSGNVYLESLDVTKNTALQTLKCYDTIIGSLDLSKNTNLTELYCYDTWIASLNVSGLNKLQTIECQRCLLKQLDVSSCKALKKLWCIGNKLTSLNLGFNMNLEMVECWSNQLTQFLLPDTNTLGYVDCSQNCLTGANMWATVSSLPTVNSGMFIVTSSDASEGNILTDEQLAVVIQKGWRAFNNNGGTYVPYLLGISTGLEAMDNGQLTIDNSSPLYNLQGQRVSHPVKGQIYIQNGRKIKF